MMSYYVDSSLADEEVRREEARAQTLPNYFHKSTNLSAVIQYVQVTLTLLVMCCRMKRPRDHPFGKLSYLKLRTCVFIFYCAICYSPRVLTF